jgi:NTE family protein
VRRLARRAGGPAAPRAARARARRAPTGAPRPPRSPREPSAPSASAAPLLRRTDGRAIGLALGGGAARGFAHIGVDPGARGERDRARLVVGTSAGSVVAALFASGKSGRELATIADAMDETAFADWSYPAVASSAARRSRNSCATRPTGATSSR